MFLMLIFLLIAPTVIGILIKRKKPPIAEKIVKFLRPITYIIVLLLSAVGIYVSLYIVTLLVQAPWQLAVASGALPAVAMTLCALASFLMQQQWKQIKTICIEVGIQNTAIPLLILKGTMGQPDADISSVPSILVITIVNLYLGIGSKLFILIHKKNVAKKDTIPPEKTISAAIEKDKVKTISSKGQARAWIQWIITSHRSTG